MHHILGKTSYRFQGIQHRHREGYLLFRFDRTQFIN